jgi:hypothetical protein
MGWVAWPVKQRVSFADGGPCAWCGRRRPLTLPSAGSSPKLVLISRRIFGYLFPSPLLPPCSLLQPSGKMGGRERARRAYRIAQQLRYQQLYHAVMSSLEAVCKSEVPEVRCGGGAAVHSQ